MLSEREMREEGVSETEMREEIWLERKRGRNVLLNFTILL